MYQKGQSFELCYSFITRYYQFEENQHRPKVLWYYSTKLSFIKSRDRLLRIYISETSIHKSKQLTHQSLTSMRKNQQLILQSIH